MNIFLVSGGDTHYQRIISQGLRINDDAMSECVTADAETVHFKSIGRGSRVHASSAF